MDVTRRDFIKALGALAGVAVASQFDRQLGAMARTLNGPQVWTLSFDEQALEGLCRERVRIGPAKIEGNNLVAECSIEFLECDLWALATLTGSDGSKWSSTDGKTWTCGDRRMML